MATDYSEQFNEIKDYFTDIIEESLENFVPTPLKTAEQEFQSKLDAVKSNFEAANEKIANAWEIIAARVKDIELKNVNAVLESLEDIDQVEEYLDNNVSFQELFGITNDKMLDFYDVGSKLFEDEHYDDASDVYYLLTVLNPKVNSFWMALGSTEWRRENYQDAMLAYLSALTVNDMNFDAQFWMARCMIKMGQDEEAKEILEDLVEAKNEYPEAEGVAESAKQLLEILG